jgi:site-specific DNA-methyltransferase (cytosine-N4-specific)
VTSRYIVGDVFEVLATLEADSVDLVLSSPPFLALRSYLPADHPDKAREIGSEATPADYLDTLLDVVEACDRVLAPHGSLVFELGDTYSGAGGENHLWDSGYSGYATYPNVKHPSGQSVKRGRAGWPLDKSLCGIPGLFAWSLAYGRNLLRPERTTPQWRIRNVVAWCRPNPPVGALGDKFRPATSYLTVATKARDRWFDLDAVRDARDVPEVTRQPRERREPGRNGQIAPMYSERNAAGAPPLDYWEIPTQPYAGAHYATWPEKLCVRPILSMCPEQVCRQCGQPRRRIVDTTYELAGDHSSSQRREVGQPIGEPGSGDQGDTSRDGDLPALSGDVRGELKDGYVCPCGSRDIEYVMDNYRRGIVLDPFAGSGTTLAVAEGHARDSIGIDLDPRNADLAYERIGGLFLTVE